MALLVGVGIVTTLLIRGARAARRRGSRSRRSSASSTGSSARRTGPQSLQQLGSWFVGAVVCPFVDFFARYGTRLAILMLAFIASYRLTDFTMGVMANPFYLDLGFTLKEIAAVAKGFGVVHVDPRHAARRRGGRAARHRDVARARQPARDRARTCCSRCSRAMTTPNLAGLAIVISADNLAMGVAGTALIAYLSSLTSASYTATQYALFSSMYALPGKLLMGTSGFVVDAIGYPWFFVYTSALGLPALVLLFLVVRSTRRRDQGAGGGG